jgi:adenylosuccinate lyase
MVSECGRTRLTAAGMDLPEMMLLAEAVLIGLDNVTDGLVVYPARIRSRFLDELPFMVTEAVSIPNFLYSWFLHSGGGLLN